MERAWTNVGREYNGTDEQKQHLSGVFNRLNWDTIESGKEVPAMPGMGIKAAIEQLKLLKPSHFAISNELAPYGLYAVRCHYKNGMVEVFMIDRGDYITILASDLHPKQEN